MCSTSAHADPALTRTRVSARWKERNCYKSCGRHQSAPGGSALSTAHTFIWSKWRNVQILNIMPNQCWLVTDPEQIISWLTIIDNWRSDPSNEHHKVHDAPSHSAWSRWSLWYRRDPPQIWFYATVVCWVTDGTKWLPNNPLSPDNGGKWYLPILIIYLINKILRVTWQIQ